jgi:hypothetical protein
MHDQMATIDPEGIDRASAPPRATTPGGVELGWALGPPHSKEAVDL